MVIPGPSSSPAPGAFAAEVVSAAAGALAALAAERLLSEHPEARRYSDRPFVSWKENLAGRIADLAAALGAGRPEIFARQVAWARTAFGARGIPAADLRASLAALSTVAARELPATVAALVESYIGAALAACDAPGEQPTALSTDTPQAQLAASYLVAVLEGDRRRAVESVLQAAATGVSIPDLYLHVLVPVLREAGRLWLMNEISVAEEHFVTTTTLTTLGALYPRLARKPSNGKVALVACVEGNAHEIGARLVADFLEMDGWRVVHLGANVPTSDIAAAVQDFRPDLLGLSVGLPTQLRAAGDAVRVARGASPKPIKVILGGPAVEHAGDVWRDLGADAAASTGPEAAREADRLLRAV